MFQQMMKDLDKVHFDYIIVYRLDRISRNVSDFSGLVEELNKKNVELIEINTKIEKAKYYPILSEMKHYYWNKSGGKLEEDFNLENPFQITIKKGWNS